MEFWFLVLIIAAPILTVSGWLVWVVIFGFIVKKGFDSVASSNTSSSFGGGVGYGDLDALFAQLDQALRAAAASYGGPGASGARLQNLSPQQQLQIQTMLMQAQNRMAQTDALSQQRYETRMADLSGMVASAGIDWTPGSYYKPQGQA